MDKFFALLSEPQQEVYLRWMDPILNRIAELDEGIDKAEDNRDLKRQLQNQKNEAERQLSIGWFIENRLRQKPVDFAKKCLSYQISFLLPPEKEFKTHIKDAQNKAYIPGTEIKGAIRTSLLYSLLKNKDNYEILRKSLENFRTLFRSGASPREKIKSLTIIADAQSNGGLEGRFLRGKEKDAKYDFLKFLSISDTDTVSSDKLQVSAINVTGSRRNIRIWAETLNPQTEFHFIFSIQEKVFLNELGLEKLKEWLSMSKVFDACYNRSKEILEEEERYFAGEENILQVINKLKKENQPTSPLLRLGWGQGFLGTTVGLKVKQNDLELYNEAIREGVSFQRRWRTQRTNFPKTRRVVIDNKGKSVNLLGWGKLIK